MVVERFVDGERDYKSYAVMEYDAHQEAARKQHQDKLIDFVANGMGEGFEVEGWSPERRGEGRRVVVHD